MTKVYLVKKYYRGDMWSEPFVVGICSSEEIAEQLFPEDEHFSISITEYTLDEK